MAVEIVMPKLGMVMSEGTVSKWTKNAGDAVSQGEVIAEIEKLKQCLQLMVAIGAFADDVQEQVEFCRCRQRHGVSLVRRH